MKKNIIFFAVLSLGLCMHSIDAAEEAKNATEAVAKYQVRNFDYLIGKISGLDDALLKMHFKLYEGYVNNSNAVLQKLRELSNGGQNRTPEFAGLKRLLGWEFNGMLLHEYYFENLGGRRSLDSEDPLLRKMTQDFGSYDAWKTDFIATGLIRGIGWVVAYIEPKTGRLINEWINEHDLGHLSGATPLLVMDVFEHAYITQFGLERNKYIEVFFNNINWEVVSKRFDSIR